MNQEEEEETAADEQNLKVLFLRNGNMASRDLTQELRDASTVAPQLVVKMNVLFIVKLARD